MRKLFFALFLAFFLISQSSLALEISEYNITFHILPDGRVNEQVSMVFAEKLSSSTLNYVVLGDVSDIRISSGEVNIDYTLEKSGNEHNVKFVVPEGTETLVITFTANDLVFAKENVYSFSTNLEPPATETLKVEAYLPLGYAIYSDVIYPADYEMLTDGERIYLRWGLDKPEEVALSFKFYNTHSDYSLLIAFVMGFALIIVAGYLITHYRKRVGKEFLRGFSEDERKVLSALSQRKVCMQKKLEREFGFSRAKMTRIVKTLESKGLVEKERVGRTNRLFYRK